MKRPFLAALTLALAAATAPAADAHPSYHYEGGCSIHAVSDGGETDATQWTGYWSIDVQATDAVTGLPALVPIQAYCDVYRNGSYQDALGPVAGTGTAAGGGQHAYQASPVDVLTVCDIVTVAGERHINCGDMTTPPIVPEPVQEAVEAVFESGCPWVCVSVRDGYAIATTSLWPI